MVIGPDETFARKGYFSGGSVGTTQTNIAIAKQGFGVSIKWNGTAWVADVGSSAILQNADFAMSFNTDNGNLTVTHTNAEILYDLFNVSMVNQNAGIQSAIKAITATSVVIRFYDMTGAALTSPTLNCAVYLSRGGMWCPPNERLADPAGNLWILMQNNI